MDRFDCQYLMATFVNVYISSFIHNQSPQKLLQMICNSFYFISNLIDSQLIPKYASSITGTVPQTRTAVESVLHTQRAS